MVLSSAMIADDRRSAFPYDRRRSQNILRSAIRDPLRSYGNQPLSLVFICREIPDGLGFYCFPTVPDFAD